MEFLQSERPYRETEALHVYFVYHITSVWFLCTLKVFKRMSDCKYFCSQAAESIIVKNGLKTTVQREGKTMEIGGLVVFQWDVFEVFLKYKKLTKDKHNLKLRPGGKRHYDTWNGQPTTLLLIRDPWIWVTHEIIGISDKEVSWNEGSFTFFVTYVQYSIERFGITLERTVLKAFKVYLLPLNFKRMLCICLIENRYTVVDLLLVAVVEELGEHSVELDHKLIM